jgi:hypothetical protein
VNDVVLRIAAHFQKFTFTTFLQGYIHYRYKVTVKDLNILTVECGRTSQLYI